MFDVGGTIFKTSRTTLSSHPSNMLLSAAEREEETPIFIDRDARHFPTILNFMRSGIHALSSLSASDLESLRMEADFYQIPSLIAALDPAREAEEECALANGKTKEDEDRVLRMLRAPERKDRREGLEDADALLVDVFAHTGSFRKTDLLPKGVALFFGSEARRSKDHSPPDSTLSIVPTREEFLQNWEAFSLQCLDGCDWSNMCVAGGSVVGCLLPPPGWARDERNERVGRRLFYNHCAKMDCVQAVAVPLPEAVVAADFSGLEVLRPSPHNGF